MSNFFQKKLGAAADTATGSFSVASEPIPDKTQCLAFIESAGWDNGSPEHDLERHIKLTWRIHGPEKYKGKVIFQKVRVDSPKEVQAEKAVRMLQAIDLNAGGVISKSSGDLDDQLLQSALTQKPMVLLVRKWKMNGNEGNWIEAVSPKTAGTNVEIPAPVATSFSDSDIPF